MVLPKKFLSPRLSGLLLSLLVAPAAMAEPMLFSYVSFEQAGIEEVQANPTSLVSPAVKAQLNAIVRNFPNLALKAENILGDGLYIRVVNLRDKRKLAKALQKNAYYQQTFDTSLPEGKAVPAAINTQIGTLLFPASFSQLAPVAQTQVLLEQMARREGGRQVEAAVFATELLKAQRAIETNQPVDRWSLISASAKANVLNPHLAQSYLAAEFFQATKNSGMPIDNTDNRLVIPYEQLVKARAMAPLAPQLLTASYFELASGPEHSMAAGYAKVGRALIKKQDALSGTALRLTPAAFNALVDAHQSKYQAILKNECEDSKVESVAVLVQGPLAGRFGVLEAIPCGVGRSTVSSSYSSFDFPEREATNDDSYVATTDATFRDGSLEITRTSIRLLKDVVCDPSRSSLDCQPIR